MFDLFGYHKLKEERARHTRSLAFLTTLAAFVGAVTALLFSPGSGKDNRKYIADRSKDMYESARSAGKDASKNFQKLEEKLLDKFNDLKGKIEDKINNREEVKLVKEDQKEDKVK